MVKRLRRIGINLSITSIAIDSYIAVISLTRVFQTFSISQEEMMSEGGDHESWDDEMMMNENNETPLPVVRIASSFLFSFSLHTWYTIALVTPYDDILTSCVYRRALQLSYMSKDDNASDQEKKGTWLGRSNKSSRD